MKNIVMSIPDEKYDRLMKQMQLDRNFNECKITPLHKGHGRIMDVDKVLKKMEEREEKLKDNRSMYETACVETALDMFGETIIEADQESEEKG